MSAGAEKRFRYVAVPVTVCILAVSLFLLSYTNDNKYTVKQPHATEGVLILNRDALDKYPLLFLIAGWEYYGGELLSPDDFLLDAPMPDKHIYIGQYGGFEAGDKNAPPHGSATYRLTIIVPDVSQEYMLELPDVFSAYTAYINGSEVMQMGDPAPASYRPETGNRVVSFTAAGKIEIIVAASDFSSLYSGMTYPPAFGEPNHVTDLLESRLAIRSAVCAVALTVALISLLIGLLARSGKLTVLYSLHCLCFAGYVSYPLLQTFFSGFQPFYVIENVSFCAVLLITMWIQYETGKQNDKWSRFFLLFGVLCCVAAAALPLFISSGSLTIMYGYSRLISVYEWVAAGYITFMAIRAVVSKNIPGMTLLCGILFFDCALVMDRLLPLFEPIRAGWFIETASFALVIAVGAVIGQEVAAAYREGAVLSERADSMERLSEIQQGYFAVLRQEMDETRTARHDLHHHFTVIKGLLENRRYDELSAYVTEYSDTAYAGEGSQYSYNHIINILVYHYNALCEQNRIYFDVRCELASTVRVSDADLCGLLSNLLENAVEACLRIKAGRRTIRLGFMNLGDELIIRVENSTDGSIKQSGDTFLSSKGENRMGYGLTSIRAIASRYEGSASFTWDRENRYFTSVVLI